MVRTPASKPIGGSAKRRSAGPRPRQTSPATAIGVLLLSLPGCDLVNPQAAEPGDVFDGPLAGLTTHEMRAFLEGDDAFARQFSPSEGLGPIFNNVSCASCHSGDGRGRPSNALIRFSQGADLVPLLGGPQLQTRAISGALPEILPTGVQTSLRLPPPVFGMGLIESIREGAILANADPADLDGDGISGRPNYVVPGDFIPDDEIGGAIASAVGGLEPQLGRFGLKAQVSSLLLQIVEAYHQDMGITSDFLPLENRNRQVSRSTEAADRVADPEITEAEARAVLAYVRTLAPPAPGEMTPRRQLGALKFAQAGCAECHVPELQTGSSSISALSDQPVRLFSDLLLHDMGPGLADDRPDGDASGNEWRTTPLWGLRLMRQFLNGEAFLLHDGRARSVEEAILLHGGEGDDSRRRFEALPQEERAAIIDFVESR